MQPIHPKGGILEDRELVQRLIAKDPQAERYFFNTYREKLYKACVYILGYQDPEAEDVSQEAFIVALQKLPEFEFRSTLHHWLFRICMYLCYQRLRKRKRNISFLQEELDALAETLSVEQHQLLAEAAEDRQRVQQIKKYRDLMGDPCRRMLELRDDHESSYIDIAKKMKIPMGTVMSRLARCKETLKELVLRAVRKESRA